MNQTEQCIEVARLETACRLLARALLHCPFARCKRVPKCLWGSGPGCWV